jgi:hypothetical protein
MYDNLVKDPTKEVVLLALILYGDKTGTDVNQRYALEPWMFPFANIPRGGPKGGSPFLASSWFYP